MAKPWFQHKILLSFGKIKGYDNKANAITFRGGLDMMIRRLEEVTKLPEFREYTDEEVKEAYALAKAAFTVEDLLRYTDEPEDVSAEEFLTEMEEAQRQHDRAKS